MTHLTISHSDSGRLGWRIEHGKRHKEREALLSKSLLLVLRASWRVYRPTPWLFPGRSGPHPLDRKTAYEIFQRAKERAGLTTPGGRHVLRHALATHVLEAGGALHTIPRLMGPRSLHTTLRYFHVTRRHLQETPSPLDLLDDPRFEER